MSKKLYSLIILCLSFVLISCSPKNIEPIRFGESYIKYTKIKGVRYYDKITLTDVSAFNYDDNYNEIYLEIRYDYKIDTKMMLDILDYSLIVNQETFECDKQMTIDNNDFDFFNEKHNGEFTYSYFYKFSKDQYDSKIKDNQLLCETSLINYIVNPDEVIFIETK